MKQFQGETVADVFALLQKAVKANPKLSRNVYVSPEDALDVLRLPDFTPSRDFIQSATGEGPFGNVGEFQFFISET